MQFLVVLLISTIKIKNNRYHKQSNYKNINNKNININNYKV